LPNKFSDIVSNPKGYIGFIYADGNKMGKQIEKLKSFDGLKKFSNKVDKATIDSSVTAIMKNLKKDMDFQIILAGGDDLIIAVPAQKAISVAIDFCEKFNKQFDDEKEEDRVTTSAAVVLCHHTMPIKNILESAEGLLKNAKSKGVKEGKNISYIDYLVTSGSALGDPISIRNNELKKNECNGEISLTMRPYSIDRMKKISYFITKLKEIDFPKNKLNTLYGSLFNGYCQAIIESSYLLTRLKKNNNPNQFDLIKDIKDSFELELFPWNKIETKNYQTPFIDMIELYEFIHKEEGT
jgi:CRISPR/Cas system-associated protein Cas10 (large subunit of type III CRISPR-Cas system)